MDSTAKDTVLASVKKMISAPRARSAAEIAKWPEGGWSADVATDDDGLTMDPTYPRAVRVDD